MRMFCSLQGDNILPSEFGYILLLGPFSFQGTGCLEINPDIYLCTMLVGQMLFANVMRRIALFECYSAQYPIKRAVF